MVQRTKRVFPLTCVLLLSCGTAEPRSGRTSGGIYFEVEGNGPPVMLVHGFSLDSRMWNAEVARLRATHRVVRHDLRGHGRSDPWTAPFSAVQDMLDVFDALALERAAVVGLSAGAELAVDFALAHPGRVASLVLASPGLGGYQPVGSFDWMAPVMSELQAGNAEEAMQAWVETPLMAISGDPSADSVMRSVVLANWRIWTYDAALQERPDPPAIGHLSEIVVPTLVLVGENDLIDTKRVADTLTTCIGGAELVQVGGAGHLINLEKPEQFADVLLRFLEREPTADAVLASAGC